MSYNVLCDKYATRQMYGYCPSWALTWEYRKEALLKEIIDSTADIIALQVCESLIGPHFMLSCPSLLVDVINLALVGPVQ